MIPCHRTADDNSVVPAAVPANRAVAAGSGYADSRNG